MKPRQQYDPNKGWFHAANKILQQISETSEQIEEKFPDREYSQPSSKLDKHKKAEIDRYLNYDVSRMVNLIEVERVLQEAERLVEDHWEITYTELLDKCLKARKLQSQILEHQGRQQQLFSNAKSLFLEILRIGVWIDEGQALISIIKMNRRLELEEQTRTIALRDSADIGVRLPLANYRLESSKLTHEMEGLILQIDDLLSTSMLQWSDLSKIKQLLKRAHESNCFNSIGMHRIQNLTELVHGIDWVNALAKDFEIGHDSLSAVTHELINKVAVHASMRTLDSHKHRLSAALRIKYSQNPISRLVREVRVIFWNEEARVLLQEKKLNLARVGGLIERYDDDGTRDNAVFSGLQSLFEKAKLWQERADKLAKQVHTLKNETKEPYLQLITSFLAKLSQLEEEFKSQFSQFEDFLDHVKSFPFYRTILQMSKLLIKSKPEEKSELKDFLELRKVVDSPSFNKYTGLPIVESFKNKFAPLVADYHDLEALNKKLKVEAKKPPTDFFEGAFLESIREMVKLETILDKLSHLQKHFFISLIGFDIKEFLSSYTSTEAEILVFIKAHPFSGLNQLICEELHRLIQEFTAKKSSLHIRIYSNGLEEIAWFDWTLKTLFLLKQSKPRFEEVKRMERCLAVLKPRENEVERLLRSKIKDFLALKAPIEEKLSKRVLTFEELRGLEVAVRESLPFYVGQILKRVTLAIQAAQFCIDSFLEVERRTKERPGERAVSQIDLLVLQEELFGLPCTLPAIEEKVQQMLADCESVKGKYYRFIECFDFKKEAELEAIFSEYFVRDIRIREVESALTKRKEALKKLDSIRVDDGKTWKDLNEIEQVVRDSLDFRRINDLLDCLTRRKVRHLAHISQAIKGISAGDNLVKKEELDLLISRAASTRGVNDEDLKKIKGFKERAEHHLRVLRSQSKELIDRSSHIFLQFIDLSKEMARLREEKKEQLPRQDMKEDVLDITLTGKTMVREKLKDMRKQTVRRIREKLSADLRSDSKEECTEATSKLEELIYNGTKHFLDHMDKYDESVKQYFECLDKFRLNHALCEAILNKYYPPHFLKFVLDDAANVRQLAHTDKAVYEYIQSVKAALKNQQPIEEPVLRKRSVHEDDHFIIRDKEQIIKHNMQYGMPAKKIKDASTSDFFTRKSCIEVQGIGHVLREGDLNERLSEGLEVRTARSAVRVVQTTRDNHKKLEETLQSNKKQSVKREQEREELLDHQKAGNHSLLDLENEGSTNVQSMALEFQNEERDLSHPQQRTDQPAAELTAKDAQIDISTDAQSRMIIEYHTIPLEALGDCFERLIEASELQVALTIGHLEVDCAIEHCLFLPPPPAPPEPPILSPQPSNKMLEEKIPQQPQLDLAPADEEDGNAPDSHRGIDQQDEESMALELPQTEASRKKQPAKVKTKKKKKLKQAKKSSKRMIEEELIVSSDRSSHKHLADAQETNSSKLPEDLHPIQPQTAAADARHILPPPDHTSPATAELKDTSEAADAAINRTTSKPELDHSQGQATRQTAEPGSNNRSKLIQKITLNNLNNAEEGQPGVIPNLLPNPSDEEVEHEIIIPQAEPMDNHHQHAEEKDIKLTLHHHHSDNIKSSSNTNKSTTLVEQNGLKESDQEEDACDLTSSNVPHPDLYSSTLRKDESAEARKDDANQLLAEATSAKLLRTKLRPREKEPAQPSTIKEIERKAREEKAESRRAGGKGSHAANASSNFHDSRPGRKKKHPPTHDGSHTSKAMPEEAAPKVQERKRKKHSTLEAVPERDTAEQREEPAALPEDQSVGEQRQAHLTHQKPNSRKTASPDDSQTAEQQDNIVRRLRKGAGGKTAKISQDSSGGKDKEKLQRKKLRNQKVIEVKSRKGILQ